MGQSLGWLLGVDKNLGGVGIAMLLLILACDWLHRAGRLTPPSERGILFWSSIYIPIVVAMAASQNVYAAINGGWLAVVGGVVSVVVCFAMVPLLSRIGADDGRANAIIGADDGRANAIIGADDAEANTIIGADDAKANTITETDGDHSDA